MIKLTEWLKDIRIRHFRISVSGAQVRAWIEESEMNKSWYGNRPHKVLLF